MKAFILISVLLVMGLTLSIVAKASDCSLNEVELRGDAKLLCYGFPAHSNLKYIEVVETSGDGKLKIIETKCDDKKVDIDSVVSVWGTNRYIKLSNSTYPRYLNIDIDIIRSLRITEDGQYTFIEEEDFPFDPCKPFAEETSVICIEK
jgi:hypothetical protein